MFQLYKQIEKLVVTADEITEAIRRQDYDSANRVLSADFLGSYQAFLTELFTHSPKLSKNGIYVDGNSFLQATKSILEAQQQKDYILAADYLELILKPLLLSVLGEIREQIDMIQETDYREGNIFRFSEVKLPEKKDFDRQGVSYCVEVTQQGPLTLKRESVDETFYFHSNVSPWAEAEAFAKEYGADDAKAYAILGLALGYHVIELWKRCAGAVPVFVYETDAEVLEIARRYQNFRVCRGKNLHILYDPELKLLSQKLKEKGTRLVIHYPSLRNIADNGLREAFQRFFIVDSSERKQKKFLYANFISNIQKDVIPAERLRSIWKGKDIYIIAAGPSLDKNIGSLMKKPLNSIVLATGTVLSKLLRMGIRPDYVIVSDANERIVKQIRSNNKCGIPMLLLSTAYYEFGQNYEAEKYILFQKDFDLAERYAREHKHMLVETGGSVATVALDVSIRLEAGRIIFLGLDLAYTNNQAHAADSGNQLAGAEEDLITVMAFDGESIYSDFKFNLYAEWIEKRLQQEDARRVTVINATEGGRLIKGMQYMSLAVVMGTVDR